jgi:hypothetical protein
MKRAAALSLLVLFAICTVLPLAGTNARRRRHRRHHHHAHLHHSHAWRKRHRAHMLRRRAIHHRHNSTAAADLSSDTTPRWEAPASSAYAPSARAVAASPGQWTLVVPKGWANQLTFADGGMRFSAFAPGHHPAGEAVMSMIPARTLRGRNARDQHRMLGGVPFSDLRRIVIDRMVANGGWVVNDFQRDIEGHSVYVVTAQTPVSADGRTPEQSLVYYFTEVEGRIYRLATTTPLEFSEQMAAASEGLLGTLSGSSRMPVENASQEEKR